MKTAMISRLSFVLVLVTVLAACAPATPQSSQTTGTGGQAPQQPAAAVPKTITIGLDEDIKNFWDSVTLGGGSGARELTNIFNAHLVAITNDGSPTPRLLAELPAFENGSWRVLPDGKMETTYKLRSNAFWHDGTPFTANDLAFSLQVNKDPEISNSNQDAMRLVERWEVTDPNTVVVTWRETYPFADRMEHRDLYPLPKHLLEQSYQNKDTFLLQPYFNADYVGLGPFKVARWETGSHIDFAAFDQYFMGRPRLDTIRVQFIPDKNTMVANLNAKTIQVMMTFGGIPEFEAMLGVKRSWEASGYGTIVMDPISYRFVEPQQYHNPSPADLKDPRVRQALLHGIDRPTFVNVMFGDLGIVADSWVHPTFGNYRQLQDSIVKYPYDVRRARALLEEAGWRPGSDGVMEKNGQKFNIAVRDQDGETEFLIVAASWKEIGVNATYEFRNAEALRDRQDRTTFSGADISSNPMGVAAVIRKTATNNIGTAENRWTGTNRGGYSNPAWDGLERRMLGALRESERLDLERELLRIYTSDLPLLPLYFRNDMVPVGGGLKGPVANTGVAHRGFITHTWNIHEWEIKA
jgi:peptide/nickel transport system substrate-binding protein